MDKSDNSLVGMLNQYEKYLEGGSLGGPPFSQEKSSLADRITKSISHVFLFSEEIKVLRDFVGRLEGRSSNDAVIVVINGIVRKDSLSEQPAQLRSIESPNLTAVAQTSKSPSNIHLEENQKVEVEENQKVEEDQKAAYSELKKIAENFTQNPSSTPNYSDLAKFTETLYRGWNDPYVNEIQNDVAKILKFLFEKIKLQDRDTELVFAFENLALAVIRTNEMKTIPKDLINNKAYHGLELKLGAEKLLGKFPGLRISLQDIVKNYLVDNLKRNGQYLIRTSSSVLPQKLEDGTHYFPAVISYKDPKPPNQIKQELITRIETKDGEVCWRYGAQFSMYF